MVRSPEQLIMEGRPALSCSSLSTGAEAAGVGFEDRQDILAHKSGRMTTHFSAAEFGNLVAAVNRIADSHGNRAPLCELMRNYLKMLVEREGLEPSTPAL